MKLNAIKLASINLAGLATFEKRIEDVLVFRADSFEAIPEALEAADKFEADYGWTVVIQY